MACEIVSCKGAVFVLWGKPTRQSLDRARDELERVARENGGPVVYITRVPLEAPPPDSDERSYIGELMPRLLEWCASYHVVMEGSGFVNALKRGVLLSLFQLRWRRGTFFVHSTADEIIYSVKKEHKGAAARVLALAESGGLLTKLAPTTLPPTLGFPV